MINNGAVNGQILLGNANGQNLATLNVQGTQTLSGSGGIVGLRFAQHPLQQHDRDHRPGLAAARSERQHRAHSGGAFVNHATIAADGSGWSGMWRMCRIKNSLATARCPRYSRQSS
jgi:hypothetical protein